MLTPNSYKRLPDFHPDRLTPAKSLTEAIPPEYDAKILLLRSDIISLLYTIFTEQDLIRQLEFTCVDRNAEILARDILIIAAAIEGLPDREWRRLWLTRFTTNARSIDIFAEQYTKLYNYSDSLETWNQGPYGKVIKFCDSKTLKKIKPFWAPLNKALPGDKSLVTLMSRKFPLIELENNKDFSGPLLDWTEALCTAIAQDKITFRFCNANALSFCYAIQEKMLGSTASTFFHDEDTFDILELDPTYYHQAEKPEGASGTNSRFTTIDCSSLTKELGLLQLLVASRPLLQIKAYAVLYTEIPANSVCRNYKELGDVVYGDLVTVSILLGLFLEELWTDTASQYVSTVIPLPEDHFYWTQDGSQDVNNINLRLTWRITMPVQEGTAPPSPLPKPHFLSRDLTGIVLRMYLYMFIHQNPENDMLLELGSTPYHYESFVRFLVLLKSTVLVDNYDGFIDTLVFHLKEIHKHDTPVGRYSPEFNLQLTVNDLTAFNETEEWPQIQEQCFKSHKKPKKGLAKWEDLPSTVAVILVVSRAKLKVLRSNGSWSDDDYRPLITGCIVGATPSETYLFESVQMTYGSAKLCGTRHSNEAYVEITEDPLGWTGNSPLIVSFYVVTALLIAQNSAVPKVELLLNHSSDLPEAMSDKLNDDGDLVICSYEISNASSLFITRFMPNCTCLPGLITPLPEEKAEMALAQVKNDKICDFISQFEVDEELHKVLKKAGTFGIRLPHSESYKTDTKEIGANFEQHFLFPVPVDTSSPKSTLEIYTPTVLGDQKLYALAYRGHIPDPTRKPISLFPSFINEGVPIFWNAARVALETLPKIDIRSKSTQALLKTLVSKAPSRKEHFGASNNDLNRWHLKLLLTNIFQKLYSLKSQQLKDRIVFHVRRVTQEWEEPPNFLLFYNGARLDGANHVFVLDFTILYLDVEAESHQKILGDLAGMRGTRKIDVVISEAEECAFGHALPAWVDRCRTWKHRNTCEYLTTGYIPLRLANHAPYCSCGYGYMPSDWSGLETVSEECVRAAISLPFPPVWSMKLE